MPWRGPEYPGEFPTLGYAVAQLIQEVCAIPDGPHMGKPFVLTDEQLATVLHHYRIDPETGRFVHFRGTQLVRPQKWGKGPFSAAVICAEAHPSGPVLFDGWDAAGEPVGRAFHTPHIQATAVSEDQVDNVFRALLPMIQLGALAADIPDTGLTRINLPGGGLIEPVTASARSRLGQRVTFVVQDQTESWVQANGGHALADNQRRGLAGMGGRFLSTPNAWDPVEDSVAQRTGESKVPGVYSDDVEPGNGSVRNRAERRKMLKRVYGDAATKPRPDAEWEPWIDLDRIDGEIEALLEYDAAQAERWFLNRKLATEGAAFHFEAWLAKAAKRHVAKDAVITVGIDGALYDDALAVVAAEVQSGFVWLVDMWEKPPDAGDSYEHPRAEVDQCVTDLFETYDVWRAYCDPQHIQGLIEGWQNRYGEKRLIHWATYRKLPIAWAVRNLETAVSRTAQSRDDDGRPPLTHSGDERLTRHIQNSRKKNMTVLDDNERQMHTLSKPAFRSPLKIDGAMAAVLAWEALGDCIADGGVWMGSTPPPAAAPKAPEPWRPGVVRPLQELAQAPAGDLS